jgi:hypothetical protein
MAHRNARSRSVLVGAVIAAIVLTGCSGDRGSEPRPESSGASAGTSNGSGNGSVAAQPGTAASSYPVPASVTASPLPDLGTRKAGVLTLTLNAVRRVSPEAVVVEGTLTAASNTPLFDLAEPGFRVRQVADELPFTYEFSAINLTTAGNTTVYLPLRDDKGFCACTQGIQFLDGGKSIGVYTYVTAPEGATTVSITVAMFAPFLDVQVTR